MILDLTHTISAGIPVYPGTPQPRLFPAARMEQHGYRETQLSMFSHTGTHMDAPAHMLKDGVTLDALPASRFCGRAVVLDVSDRDSITTEYLQARGEMLRSVDFVLFYTGWEQKWPSADFLTDGYACLTPDAARYLLSCDLKGVGTDAVSMDPLSTETFPIHKTLLDGGLVLLECLCLNIAAGRSDLQLFALPLKYENADGASVRAVAEIRNFTEKEMA
jgi:kynurenine formamidase